MSLTKVSYSMIKGAVINVQDYGADPTGATDSSGAIQAALDAIASNVTVVGGGGNYKCFTGIVIKGGFKTLDLEGGTLTFVSALPTYGVTLRTTALTAAGQEYRNSIVNAFVECTGLTSGGSDNIGIYMQGKSINNVVRNVMVQNVDGVGIWVDGGLDSGAFISPEKGTLQDINLNQCDVGVKFLAHSVTETISGWTLSNVYAATCSTSFYITGCTEFSMTGINAESFTAYGLRLDDAGWGGGHILMGGFIESSVAPGATYENLNPANPNFIMFKGSSGATPANLLNLPGMYIGSGANVSVWNEQAAFCQNGTTPTLLTTKRKGVKVHIFAASTGGNKQAYSEWWVGSDLAGTATIPILIFQRESGVFTTTKGTPDRINIYYAGSTGTEYTSSPIGYYVQNLATATNVSADTISIKMIGGYG